MAVDLAAMKGGSGRIRNVLASRCNLTPGVRMRLRSCTYHYAPARLYSLILFVLLLYCTFPSCASRVSLICSPAPRIGPTDLLGVARGFEALVMVSPEILQDDGVSPLIFQTNSLRLASNSHHLSQLS